MEAGGTERPFMESLHSGSRGETEEDSSATEWTHWILQFSCHFWCFYWATFSWGITKTVCSDNMNKPVIRNWRLNTLVQTWEELRTRKGPSSCMGKVGLAHTGEMRRDGKKAFQKHLDTRCKIAYNTQAAANAVHWSSYWRVPGKLLAVVVGYHELLSIHYFTMQLM